MNGTRPWSGLAAEPLREVAKIIGCQPMRVMVAAGRVTRDDFFGHDKVEFEKDCYAEMLAHPRLAAYVPRRTEWEALSSDARQCFMLMF